MKTLRCSLVGLSLFLAGISALFAEPLKVAVSVLPQAGFVEAIGGERIELIVLVDEGKDPHSFSPSPKRVTDIAEADLWFTSGMPFEELLLEKIESRKEKPRIVSMNRGIELAPNDDHHHHDHEHEHEHKKGDDEDAEEGHEGHDHAHGEHCDHGEFDPHSWLSPTLIPIQLMTIAEELGKLAPEFQAEFDGNAAELTDAVLAMDERLAEELAPLKGSTFYVFHAAFGYFAGAYGLEQASIEMGGREPSAKHLTHLIDEAREEGVKLIVVQPQFSDKSARKIADQIGATVVSVDPLGRDVLATLRGIADAVKASREAS